MDQARTLRELVRKKKGGGFAFSHGADRTEALLRTIAVASGKGGVGKTNLVANLAYELSALGKKIVILDADLGLANVDVLLGLKPKYNLLDVLSGKKSLEEIVVEGPGGVEILPACSGVEELASLSDSHKFALLSQLAQLGERADFTLIDIAAGISSNVLFFASSARHIIIVFSPEPTSIADAYAIIKVLSRDYSEKRFKLIVNNVKDEQEAGRAYANIEATASRFLGISLEYTGHVVRDGNLEKAVRRQKAVSQLYPQSASSKCFRVLAKKLSEDLDLNPAAPKRIADRRR